MGAAAGARGADALLAWCQQRARASGVQVDNFTSSWADGLALWYAPVRMRHTHRRAGMSNVETTASECCGGLGGGSALVHSYRPDLIPFKDLTAADPSRNLELAFAAAEKMGVGACARNGPGEASLGLAEKRDGPNHGGRGRGRGARRRPLARRQ